MTKPTDNNLRGMFLDADDIRIIVIDLPLITKHPMGKKRVYGELALIGDFHYGHEEFSSNVLHGYLNYFKKNPKIQFGLMGDYVNYAQRTWHIRDEVMDIDQQIETFCNDWRPFKDRIRFMLSGNHDEGFIKLTKSYRFLRNLALEMGIDTNKCSIGEPQRGYFLVIKVGNKLYGGYVHHGSTNARINRKLQLKRMGSNNQVCFIAHGHTHELSWGEKRTFRSLELINGEVKNVVRRQFLVSTGCFLRYPSYAEAKSYPYTDVGCPILRFYADDSEMEIYDLTAHYKEFLTRGGVSYQGIKKALSTKFKKMIPKKATCPNCGSNASHKRGIEVNKIGKRQRYQCLKCGKWFSKKIENTN